MNKLFLNGLFYVSVMMAGGGFQSQNRFLRKSGYGAAVNIFRTGCPNRAAGQ
jgi:hypothetical protein